MPVRCDGGSNSPTLVGLDDDNINVHLIHPLLENKDEAMSDDFDGTDGQDSDNLDDLQLSLHDVDNPDLINIDQKMTSDVEDNLRRRTRRRKAGDCDMSFEDDLGRHLVQKKREKPLPLRPLLRGPPLVVNSRLLGVNKSLLYNGSRFAGHQKSKGNCYDVSVVLQHVDEYNGFMCGYLKIKGKVFCTGGFNLSTV